MMTDFDSVSPIKISELNIINKAMKISNVNSDLAILGISEKSNLIQNNFAFFALSGFKTHGANFAKEAVLRGAILIVSDAVGEKIILELGIKIPIFIFKEPREILAKMASSFFKSQPSRIIGVTGTNGKTSVAHHVREFLQFLGEEAASIGTTGVDGQIKLPLNHTTPDPIKLHWILSRMAERNISNVVIEASSHGLAQHRLDEIRFSVGAFTNLSRDHFDYHKNIKSYFAAKSILFKKLIPANGGAAICIDDDYGSSIYKLAKSNLSRVITVGKNKRADIRILSQSFNEKGQNLKFVWV